MTEPETHDNKQEPKLRLDQEQYKMLIRCYKAKDITEWNDWRDDNPAEEVFLEGARLSGYYLQEANLRGAHLEGIKVRRTHLEGAKFRGAHLEGAIFVGAHLQGAEFTAAVVDGSTQIWECKIDRKTDFSGVGLDGARVEPGLKQLLKYNIRRKHWEKWYEEGGWWKEFPRRLVVQTFWRMSDYGRSTGRIILVFFVLALVFACRYWAEPQLVDDLHGTGTWWGDLVRAVYFSVVTMTTFGFGDMYAAKNSILGQILLMVQVLLGYILLGALVTRFAVLFAADGPAGTFANSKKQKKTKSKQ